MSTVNAILEVDADGTLHLPIPPELRNSKLRVVASLQAITVNSGVAQVKSRKVPKATPEMLAKRKAALEALREAGGLSDVIPDPCAWQREIRKDRKLPDLE